MKNYDSTPSPLTRIKDFISDNISGVIATVIIAIIVFILGVLLIPVKGTMTVKSTWWDWQIPINKFAEVSIHQITTQEAKAYMMLIQR